jgi:aminomethyltransferase
MAVSLVSGLRPADRSFESWWVRPGAATVLELHGGDRLTVIDPDGGQPAEVTALAPDGREDLGALGAAADADATVLRSSSSAATARPARPSRSTASATSCSW